MYRTLSLSRERMKFWLLALTLLSGGLNAAVPDLAGVSFYKLDPTKETVRMYWQQESGKPYRTLAHLVETVGKKGQINMAINGGIYSKDYRPEGLYIENGKTLTPLNKQSGEGNFFIRPGGVLLVRNGQVTIDTLDSFRADSDITFAVQSGPILLQNGKINSKFSLTSESRKIRNGVGVTTQGDVYFLLTNRPMNFYEFAQYAAEQLKITELLYLDGTISAMYTPITGIPYHRYPYVTMITVENK